MFFFGLYVNETTALLAKERLSRRDRGKLVTASWTNYFFACVWILLILLGGKYTPPTYLDECALNSVCAITIANWLLKLLGTMRLGVVEILY